MGDRAGESRFWGSILGLRRAPIRPATVQVNQDVTRLGAFAGADDAAVLQLIHDAGGAAIAEAQAALEEGDAWPFARCG